MPYTYSELLDHLRHEEETNLLELLDISSEDIVARFEDIIEERAEELFNALDEEQESEHREWFLS